MAPTAISVLSDVTGINTERTEATSNILILNQHIVLLLTVMKFQYLSLENFLTLVTKNLSAFKKMK